MYDYDSQEPYRATKLWNEVILAFRTGMPLKKHRWRMRSHDDCFMASECISWLNCYLKNNSNFGQEVTRLQTIQLLQKFVKCNVIESVGVKTKKVELSDNSQLYRFVQYSPIKPKKKPSLQTLLRTPLSVHNINRFENECKAEKNEPLLDSCIEIHGSTRTALKLNVKKPVQYNKCTQNIIPECHFVSRHLSVEEIENIWKAAVIKRLEFAMVSVKLQDILDLKRISGRFIFHNVTRVSKSGVVTLIDKTDDIPHWVISAMKCLVNWPNASGSGSCLPNYPGFEKDVFKVVRDFFINSEISLVPCELGSVIFELCREKICADVSCNTVQGDELPNSSAALEVTRKNQKTSTPLSQNSAVLSLKIGSGPLMTEPLLSCQCTEGKILLDDPDAMWECPPMCFETEFFDANPVTNVVASDSLAACFSKAKMDLPSMNSLSIGSIDTMSTISACSQISKKLSVDAPRESHGFLQSDDDELFFSAIDSHENNVSKSWGDGIWDTTFKHCSYDNLEDLKDYEETPVKSCSSLNTLTLPQKCKNLLGCQLKLNSVSVFAINKDGMKLKTENNSSHEYSSTRDHVCFEPNDPQACPSDPNSNSKLLKKKWYGISRSDFPSLKIKEATNIHNIEKSSSTYVDNFPAESSLCKPCLQSIQSLENNTLDPGKASSFRCIVGEEQKFKELFQIVLLLLPPSNRRQLHLLFRMISKVVKNNRLTFDFKIPLRRYLLETFLPSVLDINHSFMGNRAITYFIVSFMLDECETLFQTPSVLKEDVEMRLAEMRKGRIKYTLDDSCNLTYCELVSQQQYEEQKVSMSKKALMDLLEKIINDKNVSEKEKKKKLKQFKLNHPEVYSAKFPNLNDSSEASKTKKALFAKLLNLRM